VRVGRDDAEVASAAGAAVEVAALETAAESDVEQVRAG